MSTFATKSKKVMKKAMLLTFEITTRVIVDADYDNAMNANLDWLYSALKVWSYWSYKNAELIFSSWFNTNYSV